MSDYGDDYSDYGEEWMYVEDEYMAADDLAEHVVNSPPPVDYLDENDEPEWDRFEYFNDLEYASDGYDDANFYTHKPTNAKTGQKRKRGGMPQRSHKKQKLGRERIARQEPEHTSLSPVVWRARVEAPEPKTLDEDKAESYAVFKDWRDRLSDTPAWALRARLDSPTPTSRTMSKGRAASVSELEAVEDAPEDELDYEGMEGEEGEDGDIDPAVLMAALKTRLAEAGGPLNGMDPEQLLQFAMRMMTDKDAGDDIAGELADNMLQGEEEDEDEDPTELLTWLSKQRGEGKGEASNSQVPQTPDVKVGGNRPPTPPSSEANRSVKGEMVTGKSIQQAENATASKQNSDTLPSVQGVSSRKRKAESEIDGDGASTNVSKKRSTRSYDAPTAASSARAAAPAKATRSSARAKR